MKINDTIYKKKLQNYENRWFENDNDENKLRNLKIKCRDDSVV